MRLILAIISCVMLCGCATLIEKGKVYQSEDGKNIYIPDEYIKIKGIGKGEFPDGTKGEGTPLLKLPPLSLKKED